MKDTEERMYISPPCFLSRPSTLRPQGRWVRGWRFLRRDARRDRRSVRRGEDGSERKSGLTLNAVQELSSRRLVDVRPGKEERRRRAPTRLVRGERGRRQREKDETHQGLKISALPSVLARGTLRLTASVKSNRQERKREFSIG